jgi:methionyl-tRNA formyltransferase
VHTPDVCAINFHNSPQPEYAGFNATAWAILEQRARHAVTWHEMTAEVDAGRIFAQPSFEIADDDTARSKTKRGCNPPREKRNRAASRERGL